MRESCLAIGAPVRGPDQEVGAAWWRGPAQLGVAIQKGGSVWEGDAALQREADRPKGAAGKGDAAQLVGADHRVGRAQHL